MIRMSRIDKPRRLLAINSLIKIVVKEGVLDIELMYRPRTRNNETEDNMNGGGYDGRTEGLVKVNTR